MRSSVKALPFLVLTIVALSPSVARAEARPPRGEGTYYLQAGDVVLMLGDAVTEDAGFYRSIFYSDLPDEYPELVGDRPGNDMRGAHVRFINAGAAGTTATDCLRNLGTVLARHKPTVAVVCFGTNDSYRDAQEFSSSIRGIVTRLRERSVSVTLMTPPYVNMKEHPELEARARTLGELVGQLRRIAAETSLPLADCYEAMRAHVEAGKGDLSWGDGVHPSTAGKRMMAAQLQKAWGFGKPLAEMPKPVAPAAPAGGKRPAGGADWISLSPQGNGILPWKAQGGRTWVEDGAICATNNADVYYAAQMHAFEFECEVKGGGGDHQTVIGINLSQWTWGRGSRRALARIYRDGDMHIDGANTPRWRAGAGVFNLSDWTTVRIAVTRTTVTVYKDGEKYADIDISAEPERAGSIYWFPYGNNTVRMRNARIRALE